MPRKLGAQPWTLNGENMKDAFGVRMKDAFDCPYGASLVSVWERLWRPMEIRPVARRGQTDTEPLDKPLKS